MNYFLPNNINEQSAQINADSAVVRMPVNTGRAVKKGATRGKWFLNQPPANTVEVVTIGANQVISGNKSFTGISTIPGTSQVVAKAIGVNFNALADTAMTINVPAGYNFIATGVIITNASSALTSTSFGVYTAISAGGSTVVADGDVASTGVTTTVSTYADLTASITNYATLDSTDTLYVNVSDAKGTAATADIYLLGIIIPN